MICRGFLAVLKKNKVLTILSIVEGPSHGLARRVVASANSTLVIPGLRVENVVTACLLRTGDRMLGQLRGFWHLYRPEVLCCRGNIRQIYPAEALNTDVICVCPTWRAINDAVLQLIVCRGPSNPAEELAAILHEYFTEKERKYGKQ